MGVVGQKHNFDVVCYLFEYLVDEIERLAKESLKAEGITSKRAQYIRQFCEGAKVSIYWRLKASVKQTQEADNDSRALVVIKDKELGTAAYKFFGHTHSTRRQVAKTNGFTQGREAGRNIPLSQGVAGGSKPQIK